MDLAELSEKFGTFDTPDTTAHFHLGETEHETAENLIRYINEKFPEDFIRDRKDVVYYSKFLMRHSTRFKAKFDRTLRDFLVELCDADLVRKISPIPDGPYVLVTPEVISRWNREWAEQEELSSGTLKYTNNEAFRHYLHPKNTKDFLDFTTELIGGEEN